MAGEKRYETKIRKYLESRGHYVVKFFANAFTKAGVPDLLCSVNGFFVAIEVKDTKGRPSALQIWNRDLIRSTGGISLILYPDQWEDFKLLVDDLEQRPNEFMTVWSEQESFDRGKEKQ